MGSLNGDSSARLRLAGIAKAFPNGTVALRGVDLEVRPASIHGLVGANGAGKSTLIKILSGAIGASEGEVFWEGRQVEWNAPADSQDAGVATIYQHVPLAPTLSVLENVFLGRHGWQRRTATMRRELAALCERLDYEVEPGAIVGDLPLGTRQMVAILQALAAGARLVVMDEPTASLSQVEREVVFGAARRLRAEGTSVLYVSHFLDEVLELTDRITVLRDGAVVTEGETTAFNEERLVEQIVGRQVLKVSPEVRSRQRRSAEPVLAVAGLDSPGLVRGTDLAVGAGEILGVAGLLGSGRTELLEAIFGADPRARGRVLVDGVPLRVRSTAAAVGAGIALVPEDRMQRGLLPDAELWANVNLPDLARYSHGGVVPDVPRQLARAEAAIEALRIRTRGPHEVVNQLSGGNAQKVVFAKWLSDRVRVLLLDEPTAGIDIGAKAELWGLVTESAGRGLGVLIVSSDFEELLALTHRILVIRQGRIVAERDSGATTEHELLMLASGLVADEKGPIEHVV